MICVYNGPAIKCRPILFLQICEAFVFVCLFGTPTHTIMKNIFPILIIALSFFSACRQKPITNPKDYTAYLQPSPNTPLQQIDTELDFWKNKLVKTPGDIISQSKIAGLLTKRFGYSGDITEIHQADSLYQDVNYLNHKTGSGTFRSLAANCITQHRF